MNRGCHRLRSPPMKSKTMKLLRISSVNFLFLLFLLGCSSSTLDDSAETMTDNLGNSVMEDIGNENETPQQSGTDNEEQEGMQIEMGSVTAKVNGEDFETWKTDDPLQYLALKIYEPVAEVGLYFPSDLVGEIDGHFINIKAYDLKQGKKVAKLIMLGVIGTEDFESLSEGKTYGRDSAGADYAEDLDTTDDIEAERITENEEVNVKITAIDHEKLLISGEFDFKGSNTETGKTYTVTDGIFINVPIVILD